MDENENKKNNNILELALQNKILELALKNNKLDKARDALILLGNTISRK